MHNEQKAAWERYVASWRAESAEERRSLFEACLARGCSYSDPLTKTEGWAALEAYMLEFHRQIPGAHFVTEYFCAHHGKSIAKWKMVGPGAAPLGEGISYGEYDDRNKLVTMTGFFETPTG
jgi:hypothetical protein